ncbi:hypothetical protein BZA05DRAFT_399098, partial [Tricharina praecox]|uniref:uncharacterized protein n=1 Tax=Tricharina praecox TaxID=43433 RepID=UPI00221F1C01
MMCAYSTLQVAHHGPRDRQTNTLCLPDHERQPTTTTSTMDPLSVAASVAGLLQAGAKVIGFLSTAIDAPSTVRNVLAEVQALHGIFRQLDDFIVNFAQQSMTRKSRIAIDDLVVILTGCVCTFSELDGELKGVKTDYAYGTKHQLGAWDRVKWAAKDQDIAKILRNLQMHKTSLSLLLSVYTCSSTQQLQNDMAEMKQLMATVLQTNPDLSERMSAATSFVGVVAASSVRSRASVFSSASVRSFRRILGETRLYRNAARNSSSNSFKTIGTAESNWSQLTGVSLDQISNISVIFLPIYPLELNNGDMYEQRKSRDNLAQLLSITGEGLQRLQQSSSKMTTTVRHRLTPEMKRAAMLYNAARKGDNITVKMLVEKLGIDKESRNQRGYTALHCAAISD